MDQKQTIPPALKIKKPRFQKAFGRAKSSLGELPRAADFEFSWVAKNYPELIGWKDHFSEWIAVFERGLQPRIDALGRFVEQYLIKLSPVPSPELFLSRARRWPDFYEMACTDSQAGTTPNNRVSEFLDWLLDKQFSEPDDFGAPVRLPQFTNPVRPRSKSKAPVPTESVHAPLPYRYIMELRELLAPGRNFKDWAFAHNIHGLLDTRPGARGPDWVIVTEADVDESDPDCVVRRRRRSLRGLRNVVPKDPSKVIRVYNPKRKEHELYEDIVEIWSPVRAVAVLTKLLLPLRTYQVRMLDSGEADTWQSTADGWVLNKGPLAHGTLARPVANGVLRRHHDLEVNKEITTLYVNTNKTADIGKDSGHLGYEIPWQNEEVIYWLSKLRRWQEKYNPIPRPLSWTELEARHFGGDMKSTALLTKMPKTCFLFRAAEDDGENRWKPIRDIQLVRLWFHLLKELETRIAARGEALSDAAPIRLVPAWEDSSQGQVSMYPLHSLRVSLLTSLAMEGDVPLPILSKMVAGHSRLVMTLYYLKLGVAQMTNTLDGAAQKMANSTEIGMRRFLAEANYTELETKLVFNNKTALNAAIPADPADRNSLGWVSRSYGMCLVGGSGPRAEGKRMMPGCHNGGPAVSLHKFDLSQNEYAPVPGGAGNCVRCRWFATEPRYLDALRAHFNNVSYRLSESAARAKKFEELVTAMKARRYEAEQQSLPFLEQNEYLRNETLYESEITRTDVLAHDWIETFRLIKRCVTVMGRQDSGGSQQLVAVGGVGEVRVALEDVSSELLELSGICRDAEIYPDENPGKAVLRRSQLLDSALYQEGLQPTFMTLSEEEQLLIGNRFMESLARSANPTSPQLGLRQVVSLLDAGQTLAEQLGLDIGATLSSELVKYRMPVIRITKIENKPERRK